MVVFHQLDAISVRVLRPHLARPLKTRPNLPDLHPARHERLPPIRDARHFETQVSEPIPRVQRLRVATPLFRGEHLIKISMNVVSPQAKYTPYLAPSALAKVNANLSPSRSR
jgi:hemin uptake protein HemP